MVLNRRDARNYRRKPGWGITDCKFVMALYRDKQGNLWMATEGSRVYRYDPSAPKNKQWTQFTKHNTQRQLANNNINAGGLHLLVRRSWLRSPTIIGRAVLLFRPRLSFAWKTHFAHASPSGVRRQA